MWEDNVNADPLLDMAVEAVEVKQEPDPEDWKVEALDDYEVDATDPDPFGSLGLGDNHAKIKQEYKCLWCQDQCYTELKLSSYKVNSSTGVVSCQRVNVEARQDLCTACYNIFNCHVLLTDVKRRLSCDMCNKYCVTLAKLDKHKLEKCKFKKNKIKLLFQCNVCESSFRKQGNLTQHQRRIHKMVTVKQQFICDLCGHNFNFKNNLQKHLINIHKFHKIKPLHICDFCDKKFTRKDLLVTHTWNHTGYRPHSCKICYMKFKKKDALKKHFLIHTGQKPFACDVCNKRFSRRGNMLEHRHSHTASYEKCPHCSKLLKKNRSFDKHFCWVVRLCSKTS